MTDIVERLRMTPAMVLAQNGSPLLIEAAAEIERLREALRALADAAEADLLANKGGDDEPGGWWSLRQENAIKAARAALARKP